MGIRDFADKAKESLNTEKGENATDSAFDTVSEKADRLTGGRYSDKIDSARETADERIGNEDQQSGGDTTGEAGRAGNQGREGR
ncbi:hypothetical protein GCM10023169_09820 [Georgenia halophila]|uniref:Antitoxin n=1 Tax=Georgenia halophila TaxID=620889 RepID=A0ABP8KZB7_9MICO